MNSNRKEEIQGQEVRQAERVMILFLFYMILK